MPPRRSTRTTSTSVKRKRDSTSSPKRSPDPAQSASDGDGGGSEKVDYDLSPYPARRTEQGVFTTPPYSERIKPYWRFKDEASAKLSAEKIWELFLGYGKDEDFVGMDIARKFIQMGRTRSLRYALRPGGKKYKTKKGSKGDDTGGRVEMKRTGEVYDEEKLKGASVFEVYERRCWEDEVYLRLWNEWGGGKVTMPKEKRVVVDGDEAGDAAGQGSSK